MSSALAPLPPWYVQPSAGRAISDEALTISRLVHDASDFEGSLKIGVARLSAGRALAQVVATASSPGWDDADALPVDPNTFTYATEFLRILPNETPIPEVSAHCDGEILFQWDFGPRRVLTVSVARDGTLNFAALYGHTKTYGTEHLREVLPTPIQDSLIRILPKATGES